jgi:DNA-binding MarR family transcriptional regulator
MAASCLEAQSNRQMNQMSGGPKSGFTATQGQYLAFIDAYTRVHLRPPAEADIQRRFGVTPPSVHQMILALERAGFIRRQPGVARSIEVLVSPEKLPVLEIPFEPVKTSVPRY